MYSKSALLKFIALLMLCLNVFNAQAQVDFLPNFPKQTDSITIIYNALQGNAALANCNCTVYAHTGIITSSPTGTGWTNVQGNWATADPRVQMTSLGNNLHSIKFHINTFYSVGVGATVFRLGMVFRNQAGTVVGRTTAGGDIFVPIYQANILYARLNKPIDKQFFVNFNQTIPIEGVSSLNSNMSIVVDGTTTVAAANNVKTITHNLVANQTGSHTAKLIATASGNTVVDSFIYTVIPPTVFQNLPAGIKDGINYLNDTSAIVVLYAPFKSYAYVIGDFNNWLPNNSFLMKKTLDSTRFWVQINGLIPQKEYIFQYLIDGNIRIADPYTEKTVDPSDSAIPASVYPNPLPYPTAKTSNIAGVLQTTQTPYNWQVPNFQKPNKDKLIIYELLLRDFNIGGTLQAAIDSFSYLKRLGINAIELMPVAEFEGNDSWGYNCSFYLALDKSYGTKNKFKQFIDLCHQNGIAVIMDVVYNHAFSQAPIMQLYWNGTNITPNSPYGNVTARHDFNVGTDLNHESPAVRQLVERANAYWIQEYKIDGYRFDLSKGFTQRNTLGNTGAWGQYDASRIAIWKNYYDKIRLVSSDAYVILEHFADYSEERELANYGMMPWGNVSYNFADVIRGIGNFSLTALTHQSRGYNQMNLVGYAESHDEERNVYKAISSGNNTNPNYNMRDLNIALQRSATAAAFLILTPGPKMIWQFGELGYDVSINQNGRTGRKPIRWDYYNATPQRRNLFTIYKALNNLKTSYPAFSSTNFTTSYGGYFKKMTIEDPTMDVVVLGSFFPYDNTVFTFFTKTGTWYDYMSGDSINVANIATDTLRLKPSEFKIFTTKRLPKPTLEFPIGIDETEQTNTYFTIYPNPVGSELDLRRIEGIKSIKITDMLGKNIYNTVSNVPINVSMLEKGIYFVEIIKKDNTLMRSKFIKE